MKAAFLIVLVLFGIQAFGATVLPPPLCLNGHKAVQRTFFAVWKPVTNWVMANPQRWRNYLSRAAARIEAIQSPKSRAEAWENFVAEYIVAVAPMKKIHKTNRLIECLSQAGLDGKTKVRLWETFVSEIRARVRADLRDRIAASKDADWNRVAERFLQDPQYGYRNARYSLPDGSEVRVGHGMETLVFAPDGTMYLGKGDYLPAQIEAMKAAGTLIPHPPSRGVKKISK